MYQREALWLGFEGANWKPNAVKVAVGTINAVSGRGWDEALHDDLQDYLICPDQPWLDGINAGDGFIRQFIAMPLGHGYTVEAQLTGAEVFGGIQIVIYEPKPGKFPDLPPERESEYELPLPPATHSIQAMGLAVGGMIRQRVHPDPYGIDTWDLQNYGQAFVYIVNSEQYRELTGLEPPATPISTRTYIENGLPWFDLYDEARGDLAAAKRLAPLKTIGEIDAARGQVDADDR
jgi:hypothetical protein